jgi:methyl-accepting chemotaxis protein
MLKTLINPAIKLMNKLKFGHKFLLIAILLIMPLGFVLNAFLKEIGGQISFASNERVGVAHLRPIAKFNQDFYDFRSEVRQGNYDAAEQVATGIDAAMKEFQGVQARSADALKTGEIFAKLQKEWQGLKGDLREQLHDSPVPTSQAFTDILSELITAVGNNSQLVLDPDIDSFYTMDTAVVQIPTALNKVASLQVYTSKAILKKALDNSLRTEIVVLNGQLASSLGSIKNNFNQASGYNADCKKDYNELFGEMEKSTLDANAFINEHFIDRFNLLGANSSKEVTDKACENLAKYQAVMLTGLDKLLLIRQTNLETRRSLSLTVVAVFLVLACYFFAGFYAATMRSLKALSIAVQGISEGNLDVAIVRESKDEIGDLYPTFERLNASLKEITGVAQLISTGDLTKNYTPRSNKDELGQSLVAMIESLRSIVLELKGNATNLDERSDSIKLSSGILARGAESISTAISDVIGASQQTSGASVEIARICEEQAKATNDASDAMDQMQKAINQVEEAVQSQIHIAEETEVRVNNSASTLQSMIDTVESIRQEVATTSDRVRQLDSVGNRIGLIVETINQIAGQTNLLALNAAIEAARAGEHGRGFAVVADEVRKLAEQSSIATDEIGSLIKEVRTNVRLTLEAMERSNIEVERGTETTLAASETMRRLTHTIAEITQSTTTLANSAQSMLRETNVMTEVIETIAVSSSQTAAAAEELSATSTEVTQTVQRVADDVEQQSAAIQTLHATASELATMATDITTLSGYFNVEDLQSEQRFAA